MTWTLYRWVWRLESSLFIGMPPAGALNRCHLYVPARALWGAVTAEIARSENESFPDYLHIGKEVNDNCRFTYLYPAEKNGDRFLPWLPKYNRDYGFLWDCDGKKISLLDREFRRRLLHTRPGTTIDPNADSAADGTLRETECINPWWRESNSHIQPEPVYLVGYVFLKDNEKYNELNKIKTLFVGGDTRYGLGKIGRVGELEKAENIFGKSVELDKDNPGIKSDIVWGHAQNNDRQQTSPLCGAKELLRGWDQGNPWNGEIMWAPGSFLDHPAVWSLDNDGYWIHPNKV